MSEENPCIGVCEIEDGYCTGCGRSADEIFGETDSDPAGSEAVAEAPPPAADHTEAAD
ncbi:DUF1289 domain-containing protein [Zoogloea sp. 1C4]|uniref:DUF1289 domain-containing protein n=1 Tax=Zoogloea sp. 1C4 TaxID=2570190 RepID=UPI001290E6EC|nr:DUF1289 domain-containing protein [Zoogloea sp. 1C4]